ncbi:helix-turn-helix domain-containing protein [Butyricicoccus faecihominis]|uniref:GH39 family glycosyl hydrolase n=1 Tax=Butyricicoccus faecihominis TaxID=1712515 RepID=UPI00247A6275|nr:helix-turn-helix domain-containing protein [Butyricicoccus faecihominis]MCQ5128748.1 helix-turn-helix domain-containing protein [Butyricicoccus faecihominis]
MEHSQDQICFYICNAEKSNLFFGNGIDVVLSTAGHNSIMVSGKIYELQQGGLYVVNRFELSYCECAADGKIIYLHIPYEYLHLSGVENCIFSCYVLDDAAGVDGRFDAVRKLLSNVFQTYFREPDNRIPTTQHTIRLLNFLQENFLQLDSGNAKAIKMDTMRRIEHLLSYIHQHWNEDLRVADLAAREFLSPNYLARLVQKTLHCTLTEYITRLRLLQAQHELLRTDHSVTHISYACGFKNTASFIHYFKTQHGMTPNEYRKQHPIESVFQKSSELQLMDMSYLLQFADNDEETSAEDVPAVSTERFHLRLSYTAEGRALRHTWKNLLNVGYAHDILIQVVQDQIIQAQQEIGFQYLRFHGILDDDMGLYNEDAEGNLRLSFINVDLVLDFIVSAGLRPFIELSYVPMGLAKTPRTPFRRRSFYSVANDRLKWERMIYGLVIHLLERYGATEVRTWRFETMSFSIVMTEWISFEECCEMYEASYRAVKRADKQLLFGGPSTHASAVYENDHIGWFIEFAKNHNCLPDFFTLKNYPYQTIQRDPDFAKFSLSQMSAPSILSRDTNFTQNILSEIYKLLHTLGMDGSEVWLVEWSSTLWQRDLAAETCYKSSWIVQTICRNYDRSESFGYWLLTDYLEEHDMDGTFHGGPGLFTYNGIPKAGWQAMRLLNRLGERILGSGDGYFVTAGENCVQLLFYNCTQYDNLYRYRYCTLQNPADAYSVFINNPDSTFSVLIQNLPAGIWRLRRYQISRQNGSTFDHWLSMGAPAYLRAEQADKLRRYADQLLIEDKNLSIDDEIQLSACLKTHEVEMIILEKEL